MSRDYCECPRCCMPLPVKWDWDTLNTAYVAGEEIKVFTNNGNVCTERVTYQRHVRCPHCGTRLRVEHELVPRFFASNEGCNGDY